MNEKTVLGTKLSPQARKDALSRFIYRSTIENFEAHPEAVKQAGCTYLMSDETWLGCTRFYVNKDGSLSNKRKYCMTDRSVSAVGDYQTIPVSA